MLTPQQTMGQATSGPEITKMNAPTNRLMSDESVELWHRQEWSGVRRRGSTRRPNGKQRVIRRGMARNDVPRVREIDGPGGGREGRVLQSDLARRACRTVKRCFEMAIQVVMRKRGGQKDREINRHLNRHGPERTISPHFANHRNLMIRRVARVQQHPAAGSRKSAKDATPRPFRPSRIS
jgi:hypothetical protein